jgi:hypothetical protein
MATTYDVRTAVPPGFRVASSERSEAADLAGTLRFVTVAFLLPLAPSLFWLIEARSTIFLKGWVNAEYLVLLGIALVYPCWGTIAVLIAEMCVALAEPLARLYYFSPRDMVRSVAFLWQLPGNRLVGYGCLVSVYTFGLGVALRACLGARRQAGVKSKIFVLAAWAMLVLGADVAAGRFWNRLHIGPQRSDPEIRAVKFTDAPIASILVSIIFPPGYGRVIAARPLSSALGPAIAAIPAGGRPNVVLVLTESWGLANDDRVNQAEMEPYSSPALAGLYRMHRGSVAFAGPTTSGETRELCGDSAGDASIAAAATYFAGCWPARLEREGYRATAVHGFTPTMFRREEWYRRFGFEESDFLPELARQGAAMCDGAFPGICDADAAQWIGGRLMKPVDQRPAFIHWVTLNSHLPMPRMDLSLAAGRCAAVGIEGQQSLCEWFLLVHRVHDSVARVALTAGLRPTIFVIVGDHAPPFIREDVRDRFSQARVPYVVLTPRSLETADLPAANKPVP